ncbi:hypothetical protein So717_03150 [Roseobacter cerasinus]|uniref:Uncharacterized protein n=1 Tax=Roseobacter cerasinus TaxID=2602289 RepID=A0A640VLI0_9RHOB|nr:hypothetical protein [Roseobacter cerasinus]GFE48562.1 hypothetical protein So717_03150 [Roseobacter cerasinus]
MGNNKGMIGMALGSWLVALAGGVLAAVLLMVLGGWGFMQGVFAGVVVFIVFGAIISWIMTRPLPGPGEVVLGAGAPEAPKAAPAAAPAASEAAPKIQPSKRLPGEEDLAARKGDWTYEKEPAAEDAAKPAEVTASTAETEARPAGFSDTARDGGADDLKKISGVGPKLEETLNSLGIWHFDQVAALTKDDIAWVDERLRFKGRIERDDWVGQAKKLASGD